MSGIFTLSRDVRLKPRRVKTPDIGLALPALSYSGEAWGGFVGLDQASPGTRSASLLLRMMHDEVIECIALINLMCDAAFIWTVRGFAAINLLAGD